MKVVLFTHPTFLSSSSMPRFAKMIAEHLSDNNICYEVWTPQEYTRVMFPVTKFAKWLGYIDQYLIFPLIIRWRLLNCHKETLFVFCDQALGPWVPLVANRPHVIHCHDLMALKSSLNLIPENPTTKTGKLYQRFIRRGFQHGKNFISISKKTQEDLHQYGDVTPEISEVVYNGLNYPFCQQERKAAYKLIAELDLVDSDTGCLLHIGGGQWYKNTAGVIKIYDAYCKHEIAPKPLILISPEPKGEVLKLVNNLPACASIKFVQGVDVEIIEALYSYADVFLFPSISEGFGWPIIEAQACGCPVITTNAAPMNEIGGPAATYLDICEKNSQKEWVQKAVDCLISLLKESEFEKSNRIKTSIEWASEFNSMKALNSYLDIYNKVLNNYNTLIGVED
jgi:glycosyltransferase involved in cell wall biosynthesis